MYKSTAGMRMKNNEYITSSQVFVQRLRHTETANSDSSFSEDHPCLAAFSEISVKQQN